MSNDLDVDATADKSPKQKPSYKLEELIIQCDLTAPVNPELKAWEQMPAVGREQT